MKCAVCLLAGTRPIAAAAYVVNGYTVCSRETHWDAVADAESYGDVVTAARALDPEDAS